MKNITAITTAIFLILGSLSSCSTAPEDPRTWGEKIVSPSSSIYKPVINVPAKKETDPTTVPHPRKKGDKEFPDDEITTN